MTGRYNTDARELSGAIEAHRNAVSARTRSEHSATDRFHKPLGDGGGLAHTLTRLPLARARRHQ
ncbi:hypothetical protein [Bowdeniella nasicola]|uniref:hypothetical protein n=1 Tax=Bowdeniella nasicola TaxID=208480 RepID=UPI0015A10DC1|nr:hypothetical protein [Bowdeniella nasicola]